MIVPEWMPWPDAPRPAATGRPLPHVIGQRPQDDGTVLVTFGFPGLVRHTVRVPLAVWLEGQHLAIGQHAHHALASILAPAYTADIEPPHDAIDQAD